MGRATAPDGRSRPVRGVLCPPWGTGLSPPVLGERGQGWDVAEGTRAAMKGCGLGDTPAPSPDNSPIAQPPIPLRSGFAYPPPRAVPGTPVPTVSPHPCAHAVPSHGTTQPPMPQAPLASSWGLREPKGLGEAGAHGWDDTDTRPQGHPHPVTFPGAGESRGETNLQLQVGKLRHGHAGPWGSNGASAGSWPPTPPPRPAAVPP